jgi:hypothetical protein
MVNSIVKDNYTMIVVVNCLIMDNSVMVDNSIMGDNLTKVVIMDFKTRDKGSIIDCFLNNCPPWVRLNFP